MKNSGKCYFKIFLYRASATSALACEALLAVIEGMEPSSSMPASISRKPFSPGPTVSKAQITENGPINLSAVIFLLE